MRILKRPCQHKSRFTHNLNVFHYGKIGTHIFDKILKLHTFNHLPNIVGIVNDVFKPAPVPRSFSHRLVFYHYQH